MATLAPVDNDLDECLRRARKASSLALVMYLTAGFPDAESTAHWAPLLAECGASVIELGIPFSDPMGDGPTIQRSSQKALDAGMTTRGSFDIARSIHARTAAPIVIMSYYNPVLHMGAEEFAAAARDAGVSGLIVPDLPIEEASELKQALDTQSVHLIYLLSPASTTERIELTAREASGFIYCMALTGVTGARASLSDNLQPFLARVRSLTTVPLIVGFGISRPEHLARLRGHADGAVVASALVDLIERTPASERDTAIAGYVKELHTSCFDT